MLYTYDYKGDVLLCHSFKGRCHAYAAFQRAIDAFKEIEAFMSKNPSEIVTLILEDYVTSPKGLTRVFKESGLMKFWFPLSRMPTNVRNWPLVKDMVGKNQRLIVFTSMQSKQKSEGIAYQWNYMVENQYGNQGMEPGRCPKRNESSPLNDHTKSLVLVNHFKTIPMKLTTCEDNSRQLIKTLQTCYVTSLLVIDGTCYLAAGHRWANFVAVDYYKRSAGGGAFEAVDVLNGELMCGCSYIHACVVGSSSKSRPCRKIPNILTFN
ncbi:hypothetical protein RND81_11G050800 [Saponaria officinalis]